MIRKRGSEKWSCSAQFDCGSAALGVICTKGQTKFGVVGVYAKSGTTAENVNMRASLFRDITTHVTGWGDALGGAGVMILGDFNMTLGGPQDSTSPTLRAQAYRDDTEAYSQMMIAAAAMDVWPVLNPHASAEESATHREGRRIDRILAPHRWLHGGAEMRRHPGWANDHRVLSLTCDVAGDVLAYKGPGVWSIPHWLPDLQEFRLFSEPKVQRFLGEFHALDPCDRGRAMDEFKAQAVADARAFLRDYGARQSILQEELREVLRLTLKDLGAGEGDSEALSARAAKAESLLSAHARHKAAEEEREQNVNNRELGDGPTAWFHDRARPPRDTAGFPMPDRKQGVAGTLDRIADHFDGDVPGALFSPRVTSELWQRVFLAAAPATEATAPDLDVNEEELLRRLARTKTRRAPGPDGIPYGYHKAFPALMKPIAAILSAAMDGQDLPTIHAHHERGRERERAGAHLSVTSARTCATSIRRVRHCAVWSPQRDVGVHADVHRPPHAREEDVAARVDVVGWCAPRRAPAGQICFPPAGCAWDPPGAPFSPPR